MTDTEQVLEELTRQSQRLANIETTLQTIAVQDNKIVTLQEQVHDLYQKHDKVYGVNGVVSKVHSWQAGCPRGQLPRVWWAIGLIATGEMGLIVGLFAMISNM